MLGAEKIMLLPIVEYQLYPLNRSFIRIARKER